MKNKWYINTTDSLSIIIVSMVPNSMQFDVFSNSFEKKKKNVISTSNRWYYEYCIKNIKRYSKWIKIYSSQMSDYGSYYIATLSWIQGAMHNLFNLMVVQNMLQIIYFVIHSYTMH